MPESPQCMRLTEVVPWEDGRYTSWVVCQYIMFMHFQRWVEFGGHDMINSGASGEHPSIVTGISDAVAGRQTACATREPDGAGRERKAYVITAQRGERRPAVFPPSNLN